MITWKLRKLMIFKLFKRYKKYLENKHKSRLEHYEKLITKDNLNKLERKSAIAFFSDYAEDAQFAVGALLKRFDFSDDNSIVDTKEKEASLAGIIAKKQDAVPVLKEHIKQTDYISWPLKALNELIEKQEVCAVLNEALEKSIKEFDHKKVEKNYDILCHLLDYDHQYDLSKVSKFLSHHDEKLRLAAAEIICKYKNNDFVGLLENFVYDTSAENRRINQVVVSAYLEHGWGLKDKDRYKVTKLSGYEILSNGTISLAKTAGN